MEEIYYEESQDANTFTSSTGGKDLPFRLPLVASDGGACSLLYQGCPNSDNQVEKNKTKLPKKPLKIGDKGYRKDDQTPSNKEYKIMKSLRD